MLTQAAGESSLWAFKKPNLFEIKLIIIKRRLLSSDIYSESVLYYSLQLCKIS